MSSTPYSVQFAPMAVKQLKKLNQKHQRLVIRLAEALAINPRPPGAVKIEGMTGLYRESVNGLRLVYKIEEQDVIFLFIR